MKTRCLDCTHCNEKEKKCYPNSRDCNKEYDLSDTDIYDYSEDLCDFYNKREESGSWKRQYLK